MKNKVHIIAFAIAITILFSIASYAQDAPYEGINTSTLFTNSTENDLLVYPNPVINNTHIIMKDLSVSDIYVDIIDMNGNLVRSYKYVPGTYNLDVDMSRLPGGLYSVRVHGKYVDFHNLKVIKQ